MLDGFSLVYTSPDVSIFKVHVFTGFNILNWKNQYSRQYIQLKFYSIYCYSLIIFIAWFENLHHCTCTEEKPSMINLYLVSLQNLHVRQLKFKGWISLIILYCVIWKFTLLYLYRRETITDKFILFFFLQNLHVRQLKSKGWIWVRMSTTNTCLHQFRIYSHM